MKLLIGLVWLLASSVVFAQAETAAMSGAAAAGDDTAAIDEIDREPVRCITASRIDRTEIVDERTVVFYMRGNQIYRNQLTQNCPRLLREKRFSYEVRTSQLCNVDFITVLEYWGSSLRPGPSCGLGMFYPITKEEAELLNADPNETLEAAGAVQETVESSGEAVTPDGATDQQ